MFLDDFQWFFVFPVGESSAFPFGYLFIFFYPFGLGLFISDIHLFILYTEGIQRASLSAFFCETKIDRLLQ